MNPARSAVPVAKSSVPLAEAAPAVKTTRSACVKYGWKGTRSMFRAVTLSVAANGAVESGPESDSVPRLLTA